MNDTNTDQVIAERAAAAVGLLSHLLAGDHRDTYEVVRGVRAHLAVIEAEHRLGGPF